MNRTMILLAALILASSQVGFAQTGPKIQFNYVQTNLLAYPGSTFAGLPFTPYLSVTLTTGEAGDAFLMEISYMDSRGFHQAFAPQFVRRINTAGTGETGPNTGLGLATVPVGFVTNISIRAWNIKILGGPGQSE